ncbi:MAG: hypothetical protein ABFC88_07305 [Thermoguttaceae bacterium]
MPAISWNIVLLLLVFAVLAAAIVVPLFVHPKSRSATLTILPGVGLVAVLLLVALLFLGALRSQRLEQATPVSPDVAEKTVDAYSQAIASRAVGMARAMARSLSRALTEGERSPSKPSTKTGSSADGEENRPGMIASALGLALAQGERGLENRPAWVDAPPGTVDGVYQTAIHVGPYTTSAECEAALPEALQKAAAQYLATCWSDGPIGRVALPQDVLNQLVQDRWLETRPYSVGPMVHLHVRLRIDHKLKAMLLEEQRQTIVGQRLRTWAVGALAALGLLGVAFGYLKADLATGGRYRTRLRWAAAGVILILTLAVMA